MKLIFSILVLMVFNSTACKTKQTNSCKPYFEFDEVVHYFIKTSFDEEFKWMDRDSLSVNEFRLNDVLFQRKPVQLSDTSILLNLEKIGFVRGNIEVSKFEIINKIFCERKHQETLATSCIPVYRDILIFRNKGQIVGSAKICFECGYHVIAGANTNTADFGQSGDYDRLKKLLYSGSQAK